jgi:hypothetical protein
MFRTSLVAAGLPTLAAVNPASRIALKLLLRVEARVTNSCAHGFSPERTNGGLYGAVLERYGAVRRDAIPANKARIAIAATAIG